MLSILYHKYFLSLSIIFTITRNMFYTNSDWSRDIGYDHYDQLLLITLSAMYTFQTYTYYLFYFTRVELFKLHVTTVYSHI